MARTTAVIGVLAGLVGGLLVSTSGDARSAPSGLPQGLPPAAYAPEPALPAADGWGNRPSAFPRTSGTGRVVRGDHYWTDFLYDDHGAVGQPTAGQVAYGTYGVPRGSYLYPEGPAANNGADIFRIGIARSARGTLFRVDWNTLVDARVPIVAFGIDADDSPSTGSATMAPGVAAAGTDRVLVVSALGAWLDGRRIGDTTVDLDARSFVVEATLPPTGRWRVRAVSGLATADGRGFAPPEGAWPGQPPVFNVAFRSNDQEPLGGWREAAQAEALADGDITPFSLLVDWARRDTTPEPAPRGVSNRWYVSRHEFGHGVLLSSEQVRAKFLGRAQPYSVYVPPHLDLSAPVALTWLLHSFSTPHTQYERKPELLANLCDERGSICVTPLGRGPDGFNVVEAELDLWEVWRRVGARHRIDWERTTLWGFSMGAIGVYRIAATHPHLFARAALVAGGSGGGGIRPFPGGPDIGAPNAEVNTTPLLGNLRGVPISIGQGALDELNPLPGALDPPTELDRLGYRHRWELYPAEDHVAFALKDGFATSAAYLGEARRGDPCPRHVTYRWFPRWDRPALGVRTVGAYWVRDPVATDLGRLASVEATSHALARPSAVAERDQGVDPAATPSPIVYRELRWRAGPSAPTGPAITLTLSNVARLALDLPCAGLGHGVIKVTTDTTTVLVLGRRTVRLPPGRHTVPV